MNEPVAPRGHDTRSGVRRLVKIQRAQIGRIDDLASVVAQQTEVIRALREENIANRNLLRALSQQIDAGIEDAAGNALNNHQMLKQVLVELKGLRSPECLEPNFPAGLSGEYWEARAKAGRKSTTAERICGITERIGAHMDKP